MLPLHDVMTVAQALAPEHLAEAWDKVGLHLGDPDQPVSHALLCIDFTPAVLAEAQRRGCELVIAYHPPIFQPLPALTTLDPKQSLLLHAARLGLALYSPHTALDSTPGGVNDFLAASVGPGKVTAINPAAPPPPARQCKLVLFVPAEHVERVRTALAQAGAGRIGNYDQCSFELAGAGTFRGNPQSNPTVGRRGKLERVAELRLEMLCPAANLPEVVAALRQTHPYEEPAFDIYPLQSPPPPPEGSLGHTGAKDVQTATSVTGQGRVVELQQPVTLTTLVTRLKRCLRVRHLQTLDVLAGRKVRRVGLCAGAGGSLLEQAGKVDVFFTGEMRHHDQLTAAARGISLILAGHSETERPYLPTYARLLRARLGRAVKLTVSTADRAPLQWR